MWARVAKRCWDSAAAAVLLLVLDLLVLVLLLLLDCAGSSRKESVRHLPVQRVPMHCKQQAQGKSNRK